MNSNLRSWLTSYVDFDSLRDINVNDVGNVVLDLLISSKCNLECKHCYYGDTIPIGRPLETNEWENLIREFYQKGVRHFHVSGKESSLDARVPIILSKAAALPDTFVGVISNGTGSVAFYKDLFGRGINYLEFSLDGLEDTHNYQRGAPLFHKVIELLYNLRENSDLISISTCLNINSPSEYFKLVEKCYEFGIRKFFATPFCMKGRGRSFSSFSLSPEDYSQMMEQTLYFFQEHQGEGIIIKYCVPDSYTYDLIQKGPFFKHLLTDYLEGKSNFVYRESGNTMQVSVSLFNVDYYGDMAITTDGETIPCAEFISINNYKRISLGNILSDGLDIILKKRAQRINETINHIIYGN